MDKNLVLALRQLENSKFEYQGNIVEVKSYLSTGEMEDIEEEYLKIYFEDSPSHAEYFLITAILEMCTNIKTVEDRSPLLTFDQIYSHWDMIQQIRTRILNYNDFYARLQSVVRHVDLEKNSLKSSIDYGYAKIEEFFTSLPEKIEKLKLNDQDLAKVKEITESPILNEAIKIFKSNSSMESSPTPRRKRSSKKSK